MTACRGFEKVTDHQRVVNQNNTLLTDSVSIIPLQGISLTAQMTPTILSFSPTVFTKLSDPCPSLAPPNPAKKG